jgi:hypothetical protein
MGDPRPKDIQFRVAPVSQFLEKKIKHAHVLFAEPAAWAMANNIFAFKIVSNRVSATIGLVNT